MTEQQRQQACLAERKAQWDDYYARQSAAKEQEDAAQARQKQQLELERLRFQEQQEREAEAQRAAERQQQKERRAAYVALVAAEQSPENHCRVPEVARGLIDAWNSFDIAKENDIHIVDIEHLTTTAFDGAAETITCHGVFVTSRSRHLIGTLQIRKNVAGDPISSWEEDASQDLTVYETPPAAEPEPQPVVARQDAKPAEPPAPTDALSAAFANGLADRQKWEVWLASLSSDEKPVRIGGQQTVMLEITRDARMDQARTTQLGWPGASMRSKC